MQIKNMKNVLPVIIFAVGFIAWQIISNMQSPDFSDGRNELFRLVNSVTKAAYEGDWHEIARTPNADQSNCNGGTPRVSIYYKMYDNTGGGATRVSTDMTNECEADFNGEMNKITYDLPAGGKIYKRKYYGVFNARYLYDFIYVKRINEGKPGGPHPYDYAVLASGEYIWLLARKRTVPSEIFKEMKKAAKNDGADINSLIVSPLQSD